MILPATDERGGLALMENIAKLTELNNQFYGGTTLSFALGAATSHLGERLEDVARRADARMYEDKRRHHALNNG